MKQDNIHEASRRDTVVSTDLTTSLAAEHPMDQQIFDEAQRSYRVSIFEDNLLILFQLYDRQTLIGEAKCAREPSKTLLLRDIAIANEVLVTQSDQPTPRIRKRPGGQPKRINYRRRGLGSALLSFLINYAREQGIQHLYGKVMQQDLENNPKLLQWYQNHGFKTKDPAPDDEVDILVWIHQYF